MHQAGSAQEGGQAQSSDMLREQETSKIPFPEVLYNTNPQSDNIPTSLQEDNTDPSAVPALSFPSLSQQQIQSNPTDHAQGSAAEPAHASGILHQTIL